MPNGTSHSRNFKKCCSAKISVGAINGALSLPATIARAGGTPLVARVRSREGVTRGGTMAVGVERESLAVFEPGETGKNLLV